MPAIRGASCAANSPKSAPFAGFRTDGAVSSGVRAACRDPPSARALPGKGQSATLALIRRGGEPTMRAAIVLGLVACCSRLRPARRATMRKRKASGGSITKEQYVERAKQRAAKRFDKLDTNHDGVLSCRRAPRRAPQEIVSGLTLEAGHGTRGRVQEGARPCRMTPLSPTEPPRRRARRCASRGSTMSCCASRTWTGRSRFTNRCWASISSAACPRSASSSCAPAAR